MEISAVVTDNGPEFKKARKILEMKSEYQHIIFLPCFAHQVNLIMGYLFKSTQFKNVLTKSNKILSYFNMSSQKSHLLSETQKKLYKKKEKLITPCSTRWNSFYDSFSSLERNKRALIVRINTEFKNLF